MFDFIFDNTGRKLQTLAKIIFLLCALAGVISFFYFILSGLGSDVNSNPLMGLVTLLSGLLGGWLTSVPIYGFGVIIENSEQAIAARNSLGRSSRLMNSGTPADAGTWTCRCGLINPNTRRLCENCSSSRDGAAPAVRKLQQRAPVSVDWTCSCGTVNPPSHGQCSHCGSAKPAADASEGPDATAASGEDWRCSCGRMNSNALNACVACHMRRLRYNDSVTFYAHKDRRL